MVFVFVLHNCTHPGCTHTAVTMFDKNGEMDMGQSLCLEHCGNAEEVQNAIYNYIAKHDKIIALNAPGITFSDMDFSGKKFYGCNFQHCNFFNVNSENCRIRISMFDFATFADCNMIKSNWQFVSYAGSTLSHVLFTNSDLVHNNFCGIKAYQSSFDDSDLYNSRFINAHLENTSFRNCNIKKTLFYNIEQTNVSFKLSNTREAKFSADIQAEGIN